MISFTSLSQHTIKDRGTVFVVKSDRETENFTYLRDLVVKIDGTEYQCIGVESMGRPHYLKGEPIGLLVKLAS